ncbi:MaoC family dehydratase [Saccharopolyspora gloriosae]|uniref:MaoC family dehydratase n=1 Tax=Saccharopolyspora gloriosae TaxID=455344 RepID=UPI001FB780A6|nr:MaoC family dehydratase [Saccharopolyspora gloriosae]
MNALRPGDVLPEYRVGPISAEKMKTMSALMRDANPIHFDVAAVRGLGLGDRVINQGPLNQAYVVNLLSRWAGGAHRVRELRLRHLGAVHAGDRLRAHGTVTEVSEQDGERLAHCEVGLDVLGGDPVLSGTATVHIGR